MNLFFITGNSGKFSEAQSIIPGLIQKDLDLEEIQHIDSQIVIVHKLQEAAKLISPPFVVEDTSLALNCLNGLPGPLIKWFTKAIGNEGVFNLADKLGNYHAQAKVTIGYMDQNQQITYFEGVQDGLIVSPRGDQGFGWNPIFQPQGFKGC